MAAGTVAAWAAVVVGVIGAGVSYEQQQDAQSKQKQAQRVQRNSQRAQQAEQTRQQLREERVRRAQILQAAEGTGTEGSSGTTTSVGALQTNTAGNIGFSVGQQRGADAISRLNQQATNSQQRAQNTQAATDLAVNVIGASGTVFDNTPDYNTPQSSSGKPLQTRGRQY